MSENLPIYSGSNLRTRLQYTELEKLKAIDVEPIWVKSDLLIERMEGAANIGRARSVILPPSKEKLLEVHSIIFPGLERAGQLRNVALAPQYRGHDCPEPEFLSRSLENLFRWLSARSFGELHPIEQAALVLVRIVDIWPFEFGNLTTAIVIANAFLRQAGLGPFFVLPEHMKEFNSVITQAISIDTQPLVNAIYQTVRRELEAIGS